MAADKILVVTGREYLARVRSKGFWIATLALPVVMLALLVLPGLFIARTSISHHLVVVDETGRIGEDLARRLEETRSGGGRKADFRVEVEAPSEEISLQREELNRRVMKGQLDAWLWIPADVLEGKAGVEYGGQSVSNFLTQAILEDHLTDLVRRARFLDAGYDPDDVDRLLARVRLRTMRITAEGERAERAEAGFIIAYFLGLLLYMLIVLYGQQILNGVIEEKSSRVVEVVISTLRPFDLMMGKLLGIGLAGLTQLAVWTIAGLVVSAPGVVGAVATLPEGFQVPRLSLAVAVNFVLFFLLGYFIYCSFYAAVGAAFNDVQEAQHFSIVAVSFLIVPLLLMPVIINDPDSTLSVIMSLVPVFTPILMMLRVAVDPPPLWQLLASYLLSAGFAVFMVWISARIYRVGILMVGKKPSPLEILRWIRRS